MINSAAVSGEVGTGFEERGDKGPFECGNCEYFNGTNACNQEDMMQKSKQPRHENKTVVVGLMDCCEYVDRVGNGVEENAWLRDKLAERVSHIA